MADTTFTFDGTERTLMVLTECLEAFTEAWEGADEPPAPGDFLPATPEVRRVVLTELIKIDLEYRWLRRNLPKRVAEYYSEFTDLLGDVVPVDLLYEEYHIRKQSGVVVDPQDYVEAYPQQAAELEQLLRLGEPYASTALFSKESRARLEELAAGEQVDEFDLLLPLGKGSFASVFLARQTSMQRLVALKISVDQSSEPQTLAQLDHDYIVRVFDQRILEDRQLRLLYMQYVSGGTLQAVVQKLVATHPQERLGQLLLKCIDRALEDRGESRPSGSTHRATLAAASWPEAVCWIGSRLAQALDYAHRRGILHRDVKPANVLLTAEGEPKLADFNISFSSKLAGASPATYFGGSLAYMSPEQLEACHPGHSREPEELDGRSDIYSLGVLLWEMLTGRRPFADESLDGSWSKTLDQMIARRRHGVSPERLASLPQDCPAGLRQALLKCLEPEVTNRYQSGAELSKELELCQRPRTQALLYPPANSARVRLRHYALLVLLTAGVLPHVFAGMFNYAYNRREIVENMHDAIDEFDRIQLVINAVAFPVGAGIGGWVAWSVIAGLRDLRAGMKLDAQTLATLRRRCLRLGHYGALIGVCLWSIAAAAYPISMRALVGPTPMAALMHFFGSLLLCGFVATAYPFFMITFFALRSLYPKLLLANLAAADDSAELESLKRRTWVYLIVGASVPMLGVATLVLIGSQEQFARIAMGILSLGSLAGCAVLFWLFRQTQDDIDALQEAF